MIKILLGLLMLVAQVNEDPSTAEGLFKALTEGLDYTANQPAEKFSLNMQRLYFDFFIGMNWDQMYLIEKIDPCIEKVEKIFGGRNNIMYTLIQATKAELLAEVALGEIGRATMFADLVVKSAPSSFEQLARLERIVGSGPCLMKAPTQLILALEKSLKRDMSQAKHYADECYKVLLSADSSESKDNQVKILIPYLNLCQ